MGTCLGRRQGDFPLLPESQYMGKGGFPSQGSGPMG